MTKINFQDLPNTTTPVNASNLNQLQTNVENALITNITTGTEFETGRVIDGKKEYGKRIDFGYLPNASSKLVAHGLSNVTYTGLEGITTNGIPLPLGHPSGTSYNILLQINSNSVQVVTGTDRSSYYAYITLYYTKN